MQRVNSVQNLSAKGNVPSPCILAMSTIVIQSENLDPLPMHVLISHPIRVRTVDIDEWFNLITAMNIPLLTKKCWFPLFPSYGANLMIFKAPHL